jgi:hypothetical protein
MSVIGSNILAGASGQGGDYTIARSLRFRSSASAYLSRTPASAGNRKTWTYSTWVKRGKLGTYQSLFSYWGGATDLQMPLAFSDTDKLELLSYNGAYQLNLITTQVFRDTSAWYHIVFSCDTTQATASNRFRVYVNGVQITSFSTATYPSQNADLFINNNNLHSIGQKGNSTDYADFYLTEVNFIDGQALTPSSFGANNASTGVWQPKKYAGTYGTNGFYLPFSNNASTSTLGNDFSGNGNNWTTNNISLTAGSTYDSMLDVPTLTSATASNYGTWNPLNNGGTVSNGNLRFSSSGSTGCLGAFGMDSGKWYWENYVDSLGKDDLGIGICYNAATANERNGAANPTYSMFYQGNGNIRKNGGTVVATGSTYTTGDIIGVAYDADTRSVTFYKNNVSQGSYTADAPTSSYMAFVVQPWGSVTTRVDFNSGQQPLNYSAPSGFKALNTFNLPTPTIGATASTQANKYFDATTWTGNGSTQAITNSGGFQPDFVWTKGRSSAYGNFVHDVLRGFDSTPSSRLLLTDSTSAELTTTPALVSSFNSNGFTVGANGNTNANGDTYVGWQWKANGTGVTNTAGSITSTVSANTSAGFSVVTWTGNYTTGATVGHGLGVAPAMIIVKARGTSGNNWVVYHKSIGGTGGVFLNLTNAAQYQSNLWNNTNPTSSVFTVAQSDTNASTTMVAYCFSEVAGYSKFGSYTGNGSSDGVFVYTGFRPKYILWKNASTTSGWGIRDTSRNPSNVANLELAANASDAEVAGQGIDILSNGFKLRTADAWYNGNGNTMIYMAFAENPFKYSLAR